MTDLAEDFDIQTRPVGGARPASTHRWRLHQFGRFTPRDWRRVGALTRIATAPKPLNGPRAADLVGVDIRTLRVWCQKLLGMSLTSLVATPGWEWVLEAARRRSTAKGR